MNENKNAYVVTAGEYSNYRILGVFTTIEGANKACEMAARKSGYSADETRVEVFPLDADMFVTAYSVVINMQGEEIGRTQKRALSIDEWNHSEKAFGRLAGGQIGDVLGRSPRGFDVAEKIARDKLAQINAEKAGIA